MSGTKETAFDKAQYLVAKVKPGGLQDDFNEAVAAVEVFSQVARAEYAEALEKDMERVSKLASALRAKLREGK